MTNNRNTGDWNTGDRNTGDRNTGDRNTGYWNTGDRNTGYWNTGDRNTGFFNTSTPSSVSVFDGAEVDRDEFLEAVPGWLYQVSTTDWVYADDMTDVQKADNPTYECTGGFLLERTMREAFQAAWGESDKDADAVRAMPGFDETVWFAITGILLGPDAETPEDGSTVEPETITVNGVRYVKADETNEG